jgi:hypothetical protein
VIHSRKPDPLACPQCGDRECDEWGHCSDYPPGLSVVRVANDDDLEFLLRRSQQLATESRRTLNVKRAT